MAATPSASPAPAHDRLRQISLAQRLLARPAAGALVIVVFVFIVFSVLSLARGSTAFLSIPGVLNYVGVASQVGIIATSVALLMIAGEFDLSVGSLVGFAGIMIGIGSTTLGLPIWLAILISMALTTGLGVMNGLIVVRTGLPSFIVTLATMFIIAGLSSVLVLGLTNITFIRIDPALIATDPARPVLQLEAVDHVRRGDVRPVRLDRLVDPARRRRCLRPQPAQVRQLDPGVGGSPNAARNLGVPVARVKITLFAATAFSASILAACQSMTVLRRRTSSVAQGYELTAITTAVIGGCLLTGGYGSVTGTALGALALGMAQIGIVYRDHQCRLVLVALGRLAAGRRRPQQLDPASLRRPPMSEERAARHDHAATAAPALLEARDISKYFGAVVALEGVSLEVRAGRDQLPPRRQRRRQVDPDQDPLGRPPAGRGHPRRRRRAGPLRVAPRRPRTPASRPSTRTCRSCR